MFESNKNNLFFHNLFVFTSSALWQLKLGGIAFSSPFVFSHNVNIHYVQSLTNTLVQQYILNISNLY